MKKITKAITLALLLTSSYGAFAQTTVTTGPYGTSLSFGSVASNNVAYPQQSPQTAQTENNASKADTSAKDKAADLAKQLKDASSKTDTASAQGYVDANAALKKSYEQEDYNEDHTSRQLGIVVSQYGFGKTVLSSPELSLWLENWTYVLGKYGIPSKKVHFEASRLSQGEFKTWANGEILASTGQKTNQQEYVDDPQPHDGSKIPTYPVGYP